MRVSVDQELPQVRQRLSRTLWLDFLSMHETSQYMGDFDIDKMRSVQALCRIQRSTFDAFGPGGLQQQLNGRRSVEDNQRVSRSSRSTSVGDSLPV